MHPSHTGIADFAIPLCLYHWDLSLCSKSPEKTKQASRYRCSQQEHRKHSSFQAQEFNKRTVYVQHRYTHFVLLDTERWDYISVQKIVQLFSNMVRLPYFCQHRPESQLLSILTSTGYHQIEKGQHSIISLGTSLQIFFFKKFSLRQDFTLFLGCP